eukprot:7060519-Karenia_brevis.AAC.1
MEISSEKRTALQDLARTKEGLGEQSEARSESRRANANGDEMLNGNLNNGSRTIILTEHDKSNREAI